MWENLHKFGLSLEYCNLSTMLWNVGFLLRPLTLNVDSRHKDRIPISSYVFTITIASCYFYVYLFNMLWFVFIKCRETGDLITAMLVLSLGISSEIGPCKLFSMLFYKETIRTIVEGYLICDAQTLKGDRFSRNLLKTLRDVKKRVLIFWVVIIGNGLFYIIKPIVLPGRHLTEDLLIIYGLEPMYETPNYQIAFFMMCCGTTCCCYLPANIGAFLIILVGYTEATMLALSEELLNLWTDAQSYYTNNHEEIETTVEGAMVTPNDADANRIMNTYIKQSLENIVKIHTKNISLIQQIEHVFRGAIAVEFVLVICAIISELLGGLENTYLEMPLTFMIVGMDCLIGQKMMDACDTFESAVYDCKWENFNVANTKTVLMMLQNSQKNMVLSAGGMATLSFSCLMSVLQSTYSAYTTLRSTM
ncbi:hypothetical protein ABMA28_004932 [Loxostege sticticalis]|uniref:Odorant receptor n=1 Tax=Loxostege sticticalis TaxID=481309 RepID=A0ABD0SSW2_LOXSC